MLLDRAKDGEVLARDQLIQDFTPFILRVASQATGRYLRPGVDEEISVALMAFDEAIDGYQSGRGSFVSFAQTVIRRRLVDFFRRRKDRREVPLSDLEEHDEEGHMANPTLDRVAQSAWQLEQEQQERIREIEELQAVLKGYSITFADLVENCPKHRDARERAMAVAHYLASQPELVQHLQTRRELPLRQLDVVPWWSRKTMERHRRYIIAVALILLHDWPHLRAYVEVPEPRGV
jgi:RNA polymerase sigma factor